ncbi:putative bifunctional diguanylate cyclase/phosphodiesterase [Noviherbaspirillum soli]|uniref:putative bifunctional diguanylate cyclase/phosphodiesterase n=1 Tax=Noviherbaspirillum soli TaxID=1064518 RepID=UPI00188C1AE5|nr:EAL domain-containing protein [Noviherbaspirillum soli]
MHGTLLQPDGNPFQGRTRLENALYLLSVYLAPALIGLATLLALTAWSGHYPAGKGETLMFRVVPEAPVRQGSEDPAAALARLNGQPTFARFHTRLAETPFWIVFSTRAPAQSAPTMLEFPSRHTLDLRCWDARSLAPLGSGSRAGTDGGVTRIKAGFALAPGASTDVLCRMRFIGPAALSVMQWPADRLQLSAYEFHRNAGLLDGGLLVLAAFVLITALILRSGTYVLFAAWLVINLRMAALSGGWDIQWLGRNLPTELLPKIRLLTTALYYTLTIMLFCTLFRSDLARVGYGWLLRLAQWTCLPLVLLSLLLPFHDFLPFIWGATGICTGVLVFFLARILFIVPSRSAVWYSASIAVTLLASLYEVFAAALGMHALIGTVNSVTAALSSSLLAALAIAEQMRHEQQQRLAAQAALRNAFDAMPIGLFTLDLQGHLLSANPALKQMLGDDVLAPGRNQWGRHFSGNAWSSLQQMARRQHHVELELSSAPAPEAPQRHFLVKATLANGKIEGSLQDVTAQRVATEELRFLALNDPLTKVCNRRGIEAVLTDAIAQLEQGRPLTLAYLDLDRFKLINDLYGHAAGDEILKLVCQRIRTMLQGGQQIGRVGGDEFVIVMPDTAIGPAAWTCRGIIDRIGTEPYRLGDKAFQVRGSIGLIEVEPGAAIRDLMANADRACRAAKSTASDGLVVYERGSAVFRERQAELRLVEQLSAPDIGDFLFLEMQPIMSLSAPHGSLNFEVLLRMRERDGNVITAGRIIPAAESCGRIGMIDRWVLKTTLDWLSASRERLGRTQFVCMNLSGASLNDERFVQDTFAMLAANPDAARCLCMEITESVALHDLDNTRRFIDQVRSHGVKIALDDFGAGYTSFSYLKDLPADVVKIDGSFIVDMNDDPANITIVEAIVTLAASLGMRTIAEWAEDQATVQALAELGVDYVQGYAVARSQAPDTLLRFTSAAGFIQDEAMRSYVLTLGAAAAPDLIALAHPRQGE